MNRRTVAAVCCIAIVTLSGCSFGFGGGGGGGNSAAYTQSADELNSETLQADHARALGNESFTLKEALLVDTENQSATLNRTVSIDGDRRLSASVISSDEGALETERYTTDSATYQRFSIRTSNQSETTYQRATPPYDSAGSFVRPVNATAARKHQFVGLLVTTVNWTQTGTVERDGETLTRYVATGDENVTDFQDEVDISPTDAANLSALDTDLSDLRLVLYLTGDGLVREFRMDVSGTANDQETDVTFLLQTSDIGTTTVSPPDWFEEAKNATQNRSGAN